MWHIDDDVAVTPETVRSAEPAIRRADAVLVTFEAPAATIREALTLARRCGAQVFVQPAPPLADHGAAVSLSWQNVDVLIPNEAEARALLKVRSAFAEAAEEAAEEAAFHGNGKAGGGAVARCRAIGWS